MNEAVFSATLRVGDWMLTTRSDEVFDFKDGIKCLEEIASGLTPQQPMQAATQPVVQQQVQQQPTTQQAVQTVQQQLGGQVIPQQLEQRTDQYGQTYTIGDNNGYSCIHGPRVTALKKSKAGNNYTAYECINRTPFGDKNQPKCDVVYPPK